MWEQEGFQGFLLSLRNKHRGGGHSRDGDGGKEIKIVRDAMPADRLEQPHERGDLAKPLDVWDLPGQQISMRGKP